MKYLTKYFEFMPIYYTFMQAVLKNLFGSRKTQNIDWKNIQVGKWHLKTADIDMFL